LLPRFPPKCSSKFPPNQQPPVRHRISIWRRGNQLGSVLSTLRSSGVRGGDLPALVGGRRADQGTFCGATRHPCSTGQVRVELFGNCSIRLTCLSERLTPVSQNHRRENEVRASGSGFASDFQDYTDEREYDRSSIFGRYLEARHRHTGPPLLQTVPQVDFYARTAKVSLLDVFAGIREPLVKDC